MDNYRNMFESRISAGAKEKLPCSGKLDADISSWSYVMAGHAQKWVERYCQLANKTTQQLYKVTTPCLDDHQFKEVELGSVGELSEVCSQNFQKCLYLARSGRPDKLARAVTKWSTACDKRLARLISYIRHTFEFKSNNIVMWETLHNNASWVCFTTLTLPEILKTKNRPQEDFCAYLEVTRLFP